MTTPPRGESSGDPPDGSPVVMHGEARDSSTFTQIGTQTNITINQLPTEEFWAGVAPTAPAASRTLPADAASFIGRQADLERLMQVLPCPANAGGAVGICAIDGMAGVGKTAFAVHAAYQLASRFPDGQLFVRLHGHTPGQQPVEPVDALASLLLADGIAAQQLPPGLDERAGLWRARVAGRRMLLLLDDATGSDQVRPLLPGTSGTLVLVTSRHRLAALPEALPLTLNILGPGEAAELFVRLVARNGLPSDDDAVKKVVELCGYLPLAITLMAGQLKHHATWTAADLAVELESATDRLAEMAAEGDSVAASFDLSYHNLPAGQQRLFRRLGLHPGTDIDSFTAAALGGIDLATARTLLRGLFGYHLIEEPARRRYRFHDLIRQHARALAMADPAAEQVVAIDRLLDYYLHTVRAADRHLARHTAAGIPEVTGNLPAHAPDLRSRREAVNWLDWERFNLHAAVDYAATQGRPRHAIAIPAAMHGYLRTQGHWDQAITLHQAALSAARHSRYRRAEASALTDLAVAEQAKGDYDRATVGLTHAVELCRELDDRQGEANALSYLGVVQFLTDDYPASTASLNDALGLCRNLGDRLGEANALNRLGIVQQLAGDYPAAVDSLTQAIKLLRDLGDRPGEAAALGNLGVVQYLRGDYPAAAASLHRALELHRDLGDRHGEAGVLNHQGAVQQVTGDYPQAAESLTKAQELNRDLGDRLGEANALTDLGSLQTHMGEYAAATESLTHALQLHRELNAPLGEAEALNHLGELSLVSGSSAHARDHYDRALAIATEIASPLEEARALEGIGRCDLHDAQLNRGAERLRSALAIYQRIGSPNARRVEAILDDHGL